MSHLVIVTGGSSGLGRALLESAPRTGLRVDISRRGHPDGDVHHIAADLAEPASWAQVGDRVDGLIHDRAWDRITMVHNAGMIEPIGFVGETDTAAVTRNVLLNSASGQVLGHRFLASVRGLRAPRELVLISSGAARSSRAGWATYGAGKAAYEQWVRTAGDEQQRRGGARVLSIAPGVVATAMQERLREADEDDFPDLSTFRQLHESGRLVDPAVTAARFWEVLDDPTVSSGQTLDLRTH